MCFMRFLFSVKYLFFVSFILVIFFMYCPCTTIQRVMCSESVFYFIYIYDMYFELKSPMYYHTKEVLVVGVYDFCFSFKSCSLTKMFE